MRIRHFAAYSFGMGLALPIAESHAGDYVVLESYAHSILCLEQQTDECKEILITDLNKAAAPFVVEGISLPADALRDAEQQADLIASGLYLKEDGSVSSLDPLADAHGTPAPKSEPKKGPSQVFSTAFDPYFPKSQDSPLVIKLPDQR